MEAQSKKKASTWVSQSHSIPITECGLSVVLFQHYKEQALQPSSNEWENGTPARCTIFSPRF